MDPRLDQWVPGWREAFDKEAFIQRIADGEDWLDRAFMLEFSAVCDGRFDTSTAVGSSSWDWISEFASRDLEEYEGFFPFLEAAFPGTRWFLEIDCERDDGAWMTDRFAVLPHGRGGAIFSESHYHEGGGIRGFVVVSRWDASQTTLEAACSFFRDRLAAYTADDGPPVRFSFEVTKDVLMAALTSLIGEAPIKWADAFRTEIYRDRWALWTHPRRLERLIEAVAVERDDDPAALKKLVERLRRHDDLAATSGSVDFERLRDLYWALFSDKGDWTVGWSPLLAQLGTRPKGGFDLALSEALLDEDNATVQEAVAVAVRRTLMPWPPETPTRRRIQVWMEHCLEVTMPDKILYYLTDSAGGIQGNDNCPFPGSATFLSTDEAYYGVIPIGDSGVIYRVATGSGDLIQAQRQASIVRRWIDRDKNDVLAEFIAEEVRPLMADDVNRHTFHVQNHWPALMGALHRILGEEQSKWFTAFWFAVLGPWGTWEIDTSSLRALAKARGEELEDLRGFAGSIVESESSPGARPELTPSEFQRLKDLLCARYYYDAPWLGVYEGPET